ncbi:hypothetical protein PC116_g9184 [Phytophthora cactorum]|nr:hypothetical protein PC116_g9184 [Phytophthora cactorum]
METTVARFRNASFNPFTGLILFGAAAAITIVQRMKPFDVSLESSSH